MTTELESYLPSIEKARAQGLDIPAVPPQQESRCAALIVMARAVRRDFWDEVVPAERVDASVPIGPAPEPADYETRMIARVLGPAARGVRPPTGRASRPWTASRMFWLSGRTTSALICRNVMIPSLSRRR